MEKTRASVIRIVVSGKEFLVSEKVLKRKPNTRLGKFVTSQKPQNHTESSVFVSSDESEKYILPNVLSQGFQTGVQKDEKILESDNGITAVFYDRPTTAFKAVLAYHQTGQLHIPNSICPKLFEQELKFWGVPAHELETCCQYKYFAYLDDYEMKSAFHNSIRRKFNTNVVSPKGVSKIRNCRAKIWSVLNNENKSTASKVFMWTMLLCVVASIFTLSFGTLDGFRIRKCQSMDYMDNSQKNKNPSMQKNHTGCLNGKTYERNSNKSDNQGFDKVLYDRHIFFIISDNFLLVVFTVELFLRLCTCPSLRLYIRDALNVIDIFILVTTLLDLSLRYGSMKYRFLVKGLHLLFYLQMLRVLRIMRYVRDFPSIRVLVYTLRANYKDIFVMVLYIFIGVIIFGNFLFFAEDKNDISSIPMAWWWGIITMTTVGYGDVVPKTTIGRILGSLCALSGVFVFSLIIPVFVNSFVTFYRFTHLHKRFLKHCPTQMKITPAKMDVNKIKY